VVESLTTASSLFLSLLLLSFPMLYVCDHTAHTIDVLTLQQVMRPCRYIRHYIKSTPIARSLCRYHCTTPLSLSHDLSVLLTCIGA
jgi:hypothetical protein